jgi:hypothetical protein
VKGILLITGGNTIETCLVFELIHSYLAATLVFCDGGLKRGVMNSYAA